MPGTKRIGRKFYLSRISVDRIATSQEFRSIEILRGILSRIPVDRKLLTNCRLPIPVEMTVNAISVVSLTVTVTVTEVISVSTPWLKHSSHFVLKVLLQPVN